MLYYIAHVMIMCPCSTHVLSHMLMMLIIIPFYIVCIVKLQVILMGYMATGITEVLVLEIIKIIYAIALSIYSLVSVTVRQPVNVWLY